MRAQYGPLLVSLDRMPLGLMSRLEINFASTGGVQFRLEESDAVA